VESLRGDFNRYLVVREIADALSITVLAPPRGRLSDDYGHGRVSAVVAPFRVFALGDKYHALSGGFRVWFLVRGLGGVGMAVDSLTTLCTLLACDPWGNAQGVFVVVVGIGTILALFVVSRGPTDEDP